MWFLGIESSPVGSLSLAYRDVTCILQKNRRKQKMYSACAHDYEYLSPICLHFIDNNRLGFQIRSRLAGHHSNICCSTDIVTLSYRDLL